MEVAGHCTPSLDAPDPHGLEDTSLAQKISDFQAAVATDASKANHLVELVADGAHRHDHQAIGGADVPWRSDQSLGECDHAQEMQDSSAVVDTAALRDTSVISDYLEEYSGTGLEDPDATDSGSLVSDIESRQDDAAPLPPYSRMTLAPEDHVADLDNHASYEGVVIEQQLSRSDADHPIEQSANDSFDEAPESPERVEAARDATELQPAEAWQQLIFATDDDTEQVINVHPSPAAFEDRERNQNVAVIATDLVDDAVQEACFTSCKAKEPNAEQVSANFTECSEVSAQPAVSETEFHDGYAQEPCQRDDREEQIAVQVADYAIAVAQLELAHQAEQEYLARLVTEEPIAAEAVRERAAQRAAEAEQLIAQEVAEEAMAAAVREVSSRQRETLDDSSFQDSATDLSVVDRSLDSGDIDLEDTAAQRASGVLVGLDETDKHRTHDEQPLDGACIGFEETTVTPPLGSERDDSSIEQQALEVTTPAEEEIAAAPEETSSPSLSAAQFDTDSYADRVIQRPPPLDTSLLSPTPCPELCANSRSSPVVRRPAPDVKQCSKPQQPRRPRRRHTITRLPRYSRPDSDCIMIPLGFLAQHLCPEFGQRHGLAASVVPRGM